MAYTKIIKVKSNLNLCLDYTSNPKKTERRSAEDLNRLLSYTQSNDKTEHQLYVSGFNCIPQNAYEIMMETKQRWRKPVKDGNILAYHIIQSFSPGEATPDQVHQIGCEFAQRFLADRFECTVSTHLDRGHLHNHIVVNSVSYADGKMFRSDFNTYYKGIRETSDELCRENRLSVIETDGKGKSYDEWLSGQTGKPTIRGMVRKDVEQAIGQVLFSALPYLYFVRHGRVLSLYPLKPEDNQKGCFRTLACVLLSCASHPVEVTASVDIYPSRIVTSILFSRFL